MSRKGVFSLHLIFKKTNIKIYALEVVSIASAALNKSNQSCSTTQLINVHTQVYIQYFIVFLFNKYKQRATARREKKEEIKKIRGFKLSMNEVLIVLQTEKNE